MTPHKIKEISAHNLKTLRSDSGMTQDQFGKQFDLTSYSFASYEQGKVMTPIDLAIKVCRYFHIELEYFFTKKI